MGDNSATTRKSDIRQRLRHSLEHFEHLLPGQAPIKDFVHHNTLHGLQHLTFTQALAEAERITGARGYLPLEDFRAYYREGRITRFDLEQVIDVTQGLQPGERIIETISGPVHRRDVIFTALLHPLKKLTGCQLNWQIEEMQALERFQSEVDEASRRRLLESAALQGLTRESEVIWSSTSGPDGSRWTTSWATCRWTRAPEACGSDRWRAR